MLWHLVNRFSPNCLSSSLVFFRLLNRNKKAVVDATKPATAQDKPSSGRSWFGRTKKENTSGRPARKAPAKNGFLAAKKNKQPENKTTTPVVTHPPSTPKTEEKTPVMEQAKEETPTNTPQPEQQETVVPETVVSTDESTGPAEEPTPVHAPKEEADGEQPSEAEEKPDEDEPMEPEARHEEAAEKASEKSEDAPDSREGTDEMTMEDPPTETPGLLCGCI